MTTQNYLMIESDVVTNICVWDGNTQTWTPPSDATMLVQATTPAMIWQLNSAKTDYVLTEVLGAGGIGFTWNGTACVTNEPQPTVPTQPATTGTINA